jgi:hypothetical protein
MPVIASACQVVGGDRVGRPATCTVINVREHSIFQRDGKHVL